MPLVFHPRRMQKADCRDEIALPAAMLAWLKYRKQRTRNSRKRFLVFFCSLFVKARVVYRLLWGQRHKRYLQEHKRVAYTTLLTKGKLNSYLSDINEQAEDMFFRLVKQMIEREDVTEQLKTKNQIECVARMNNIRSRAAEIVNHDLIYI